MKRRRAYRVFRVCRRVRVLTMSSNRVRVAVVSRLISFSMHREGLLRLPDLCSSDSSLDYKTRHSSVEPENAENRECVYCVYSVCASVTKYRFRVVYGNHSCQTTSVGCRAPRNRSRRPEAVAKSLRGRVPRTPCTRQ